MSDEFNTLDEASARKVARGYGVPVELIVGTPRSTWLLRRLLSLKWSRITYNEHGRISNGITWWKYSRGPLVGWGIWRVDTTKIDMPIGGWPKPSVPNAYLGYFRGQHIYALKPKEDS